MVLLYAKERSFDTLIFACLHLELPILYVAVLALSIAKYCFITTYYVLII